MKCVLMSPCRSGLSLFAKAVAKLSGSMVLKKETQTTNILSFSKLDMSN